MAGLISLYWYLLPNHDGTEPLLLGAVTYLVYSIGSKYLIATQHRRGMKALSRNEFDVAIEHFENSYRYFSKHAWLDRFRSITMLSPSVWSYREMSLLNIASVFMRKGDFAAAETACQCVLAEFPNNEIVVSTLAMIRSREK